MEYWERFLRSLETEGAAIIMLYLLLVTLGLFTVFTPFILEDVTFLVLGALIMALRGNIKSDSHTALNISKKNKE